VVLVGWFALVSSFSSFHKPRPLPLQKISEIVSGTDIGQLMRNVKKLAVVRVPDTTPHTSVQKFLLSKFNSNSWKIETDSFETETPKGIKKFTNLIFTHNNPNALRYLVIAAHYDSKYFQQFSFIGATDSAVPCALLLDAASSLLPQLNQQILSEEIPTIGLQIIFFDGEEAFREEWTTDDSLYGSRHLAELWENTITDSGKRRIEEIELFVLLDLIGTSSLNFVSFYHNTSRDFDRFISIERRLKDSRLSSMSRPVFSHIYTPPMIDDDHRPFLRKGVRVLHLIGLPFPSVWHTARDNLNCLHTDSILHFANIFKTFISEYLHL